MAQTTFAGKKNPFTGQPLKPVRYIDPSALKISADPVVDGRARIVSKFDALFSQLKPGQCLICEPEQAPKLNAALRKWLDNKGLTAVKTKAMTRYPTDGKGRVWRLS